MWQQIKAHGILPYSLVIGQRLVARYQQASQEKPPTPLATERSVKTEGVVLSQEAESGNCGPSFLSARHGDDNGPGTAQETASRDGRSVSDMPHPLRSSPSSNHVASTQTTDYVGVSEATGL